MLEDFIKEKKEFLERITISRLRSLTKEFNIKDQSYILEDWVKGDLDLEEEVKDCLSLFNELYNN